MEPTGLDNKLMGYGMLFAVCNRIQTFGDGQFKDITMKQHFMMIVLEMYGDKPPTLRELGDAVGCSYQNIKRMAAQLEKNNYVSIVEDCKDKRKRKIIIADKFPKMGEENKKMTQVFMKSLFSGIQEEELSTMVSVLKRMESNIRSMGDVSNNDKDQRS